MSREKQIDEIAKEICSEYDCVIPCQSCAYYGYANCRNVKSAEKLYNAGYCKQREGRWEKRVFVIFDSEKVGYRCSECNTTWDTPTPFCPNC